ncbi:MAG: hypothetical protein ACI38B_02055, partial [Bifidobacterium sp.]|uniref:hypothetical protein n=1 Tax=Bifidobacterium sp. TaxID=41200 RepID=UPI003F065224
QPSADAERPVSVGRSGARDICRRWALAALCRIGDPYRDTLIVAYTTNVYAGQYEHVTIVTIGIVTIGIVVTIVTIVTIIRTRTRHAGICGQFRPCPPSNHR